MSRKGILDIIHLFYERNYVSFLNELQKKNILDDNELLLRKINIDIIRNNYENNDYLKLTELITELEKKQDKSNLFLAYIYGSNYHALKNEFKLAKGELIKAEAMYDLLPQSLKENYSLDYCLAIYLKSQIEINTKNYTVANELLIFCIELLKESKDYYLLAYANISMAFSLIHSERIPEAIRYLDQSVKIRNSKLNNYRLDLCYNLYSFYYEIKGDVDLAIAYAKKGIDIVENNYLRRMLYLNMASALIRKGQLTESKRYIEKVYELPDIDEYFSSIYAKFLFLQIVILEKKAESEIRKILSQMAIEIENFNMDNSMPFITKSDVIYFYQLSKALILKESPRLREKIESQLILEELIQQDQTIYLFTHKLTALYNLCELKILEFQYQPDNRLLVEIENHLDNLIMTGQKQEINHVLINSLILKSKLALIQGDLDVSWILLDQAKQKAIENNLKILQYGVENEERKIKNEITKWQDLLKNNNSILERIKLTDIKNYISEAKQLINH